MKGNDAPRVFKLVNKHRLGAKARTVTLTTGMVLGVAGTSGGLLALNSSFLPPQNGTSDNIAHAQTIHRGNQSSGITLSPGGVSQASGWIRLGFGGTWAFSLQRGVLGNNEQSWIYCINSGLTNGGGTQNVTALSARAVAVASAGGQPANVNFQDLRRSGVLNLMEMAGHRGYQGLAKYRDRVFEGIDPDTRVEGYGLGGYPGSFYALVMQTAVHASEIDSFYNHGGGLGLSLSHMFKSHYLSGYGMSGVRLSNGRWVSGARVAQMAHELCNIAQHEYHSPDLNEIANQTFSMDVQGRGMKYDRSESDSSKYGSKAETRWGKGIDNADVKAAKLQQPKGLDNTIGTEPIAVTGSNLNRPHVQVRLSLSSVEADPDVNVNGVRVHSHAMDPKYVYGYQVSKTLTKTGKDDSTNVSSSSIKWDDHLYKFSDNVDFDKLNGHYIRLVVDNGAYRDGKWTWNGFNKIGAHLTVTIPEEKANYPLSVLYSVNLSHQDYTTSQAMLLQFNKAQMDSDLIFHVRQSNGTPPPIIPPTIPGTTPPRIPGTTPGTTPPTTPGTTPQIKTLVAVPSSFDEISTHFSDKHIESPKAAVNNDQLDTFSDGKNNQNPVDFKQVTPKQNDVFKSMLSQRPISSAKKLVPGKEYAYTLHLKTGPDIRKQGSEELVQLTAKDVKLPKWFVYKTAVASVGSDSHHQSISNALTKKADISYKPSSDGSGSVRFQVGNLNKDAELMDALRPALTSDDGEVDVTIFGTIDPNAEANARMHNEFFGDFHYDSDEKTTHGTNPHQVTTIRQDTLKGVFSGSPESFLKKVATVNPKFGKTVGMTDSGNSKGYLSLQSDQIKIGHIRGLNTNETADKTGAYGEHSNQVIEPKDYNHILPKHLKIKTEDEQKNLYYVVIANSGNSYGKKDADGFERLHFSDYLDPNLKLDLKNRPMVAYDLSEMQTRKSGENDSVMAPFAHAGFLGIGGGKATSMFNAKTAPGVKSYMSNIIFDSTNQLSSQRDSVYGVSDASKKALVNGLGAYADPTDMRAWNDGVGKVGTKNYSVYYRASKGNGYHDFTELGKVNDDFGSYDPNKKNNAGDEIGWYSFSHGVTDSLNNGATTTRDLDGRQRISWNVSGADARSLSAHTVMFMVPVKVKDNATYVTNNNQTPDIQNTADYHGSNEETPGTPDGGNPTTNERTGTNHGNGWGWSDTVVINPIRKDMKLQKEQDTIATWKSDSDPKGWTSADRHENLDDTFKFRLNIQMPNWADKNNLEGMHGRAAKFQVYDKMALPYDVKDIRVYDETAHKTLVPSLKSGIQDGQLQLVEQKGAWGTASNKPNYNTKKVITGPDPTDPNKTYDNPLQHPKIIYRPYGNVNGKIGSDAYKPQKVYQLANHKLSMQIKVDAPFEQGETNQRLGKLSNAKTDSLYDEYMEKHNQGSHKYVIPNTFNSTHQSTTDDENDGSHTSNTITTSFGSKGELNVDAMRIDTNKIAQGDNFKLFFSTKMPFGTSNDDFDGNVHVKVYADKMDNEKLTKDVTLYDKSIPLKDLTSIDKIRTFKGGNASLINSFQQGSQAIGKYTLNGNLNVKDNFDKAFGKAQADNLMDYYSGVDLKDQTKDGKSIDYLKSNKYDSEGAIHKDTSDQAYDSHRRPLYVRVKVTADEQTNNRDISINGDRSFRGSDGKFVNPFASGMVSRADFAYHNAIDPRFVSVAPESSYAYFGQNREGLGESYKPFNDQFIDKFARKSRIDAPAQKGVSMIQTIYDATQLHRFNDDKTGSATKNMGQVDQTIGAGAGDGIRNDVRLQRFGWGNLNATPSDKDSDPTYSTKKMMQSDQMRFLFDSSLENGSGIDYKNADPDAVNTAHQQYYRTTGANVAANWTAPNSFWSINDGNLTFHEDRAKANGFKFVKNHAMKTDKLWAKTQSEAVTSGRGKHDSADAIFYTVPRAVEQQQNLLKTGENYMAEPSAFGALIDSKLTNLQTSQYAVDGNTGIHHLSWNKNNQGYLADNQAVNLVTSNESGITSIGNAPNREEDDQSESVYSSKKSNGELATDAGNFFTTDIGNNYNNYHFYARKLKRGTGQVVMSDDTSGDTDVNSSKVTDNSRGRKMPGFVEGGDKFYLPLWFTNNDEHDTFSRGTGQAVINPLVYFSDGSQNRINADYSDVNFTRWLRVFGHRYGFDGSNSSDYDSILVSGHLDGSSSKSLNSKENEALQFMQGKQKVSDNAKNRVHSD